MSGIYFGLCDPSLSIIKNNFTEVIIDGGNHAQFGNYGNQSKDGHANITAKSQQDQSVEAIMKFIESLT